MLLGASLGLATSCADSLDLSPIDYYGAGNFWQNEEQAIGNLTAQMSQFRGQVFNWVILYGEIRGGAYTRASSGSDGSSLYYQYLRDQNLSQTNYGIANFGGYWGLVAFANLFIYNVENADYFSDEDTKNYCLGMVYGMRAYYYFTMYRAYGGVPLRLTPDVENGNYDSSTLYMARATASETMSQIKSLGGNFQTSVGKTTDYLVMGEKAGNSKRIKAEQLGTKVINESELLKLLGK